MMESERQDFPGIGTFLNSLTTDQTEQMVLDIQEAYAFLYNETLRQGTEMTEKEERLTRCIASLLDVCQKNKQQAEKSMDINRKLMGIITESHIVINELMSTVIASQDTNVNLQATVNELQYLLADRQNTQEDTHE